jgi:hypothetical protein
MPQTVVLSMTLFTACQATGKHAVSLTDAFDFRDHLLVDILGSTKEELINISEKMSERTLSNLRWNESYRINRLT